MVKKVILCADDYGQAPAISQAILNLAHKRRLSAISCMVNTPYWQSDGQLLLPLQGQVDIGLHLNLTSYRPLSEAFLTRYGRYFSLPGLLIRSFLGRLDKAVLVAECTAQIAAFQAVMGRLPRFIDGHQHVHQFPTIREAVLTAYQQHFPKRDAYWRVALTAIHFTEIDKSFIKKIVINLSVMRMKPQLMQHNIQFNPDFAGIYSFNQVDYHRVFLQALHRIQPGGLIMCHPGLTDATSEDIMDRARAREYQFFNSDHFIDICAQKNISISRFSDIDCV